MSTPPRFYPATEDDPFWKSLLTETEFRSREFRREVEACLHHYSTTGRRVIPRKTVSMGLLEQLVSGEET